MGSITFLRAEEVPFVPAAESVQGGREAAEKIAPDALAGVAIARYLDGHDGGFELFAVRLEPGHQLAPHAHRDAEIIYVVEGTLVSGNRRYGRGSALSIPGGTLYAVRAGEDGLTFLNVRARRDASYLTAAQLRAERATRRPG